MRYSTKGVLPVPPTLRFPTDIIFTEWDFSSMNPQSNSLFLRYVITPYIFYLQLLTHR